MYEWKKSKIEQMVQWVDFLPDISFDVTIEKKHHSLNNIISFDKWL